MKYYIKKLIKSNNYILYITSFIYNIPFYVSNIFNIRKLDLKIKGAFIKNVKLNILNKNNVIVVEKYSRLNNCDINMLGNKSILHIKKNCIIKDSSFWFEDKKTKIIIGNETTFESVHIAALEDSRKVCIGDDCMFSRGIEIRTGDSHSVIDSIEKKKINHGKDILIEDHVWLGANSTILKGVNVGKNSIVGIQSVVTSDVLKNTLVCGIPAKVKKKNINWTRESNFKEKSW
ncbi:acyltransferase [Clostridium perfringens]|uniref:acyltransferase n=1 Tax=Clostridium perfringens TaxID=1502 RepID=UPI000E15B82E|nr:acyltransferase [Clostridium perfringens]EJT6493235.1 acyltransferase [Clostridium perfringens]MBI6016266.1 acyltransferase [Clostridium perfringens]MDH5064251.1 Maltose O-acetyltransferase [Clostridium perfringens]MDK0592102.1 acyltransferase [Clostridium perfringens]MDK0595127.1 acyltransferase [Clostridium perfringens]